MPIPRNVALALVAALAVAADLTANSPQADAKVGEILAAARQALGGEAALAKVQTLSVNGATRRVMGDREIAGDVTIDFVLPDKMKRTDSFGMPGGPTMERVSVINGSEVWDDSTNRGGGGFMMRMGGPGGPWWTGRAWTGTDRGRSSADARRAGATNEERDGPPRPGVPAAHGCAGRLRRRGGGRRRQSRRHRGHAAGRNGHEAVHRSEHPPAIDGQL